MAYAAPPLVAVAQVHVTEPFAGIRYTHRVHVEPQPLQVHILEIDLQAEDVRLRMTPSNGVAAGENTARTVLQHAQDLGAQAAINASFFLNDAAGYPALINRGMVASDGDVYSPFGEDGDHTRPWPVLNVSADNVAAIVDRVLGTDRGTDPAIELYNAVSGSERIVTGGVNTAGHVTYGQPTQRHPRTVAGITADQTLVLMVIDGRQSGFSVGATSAAAADLLIQYGVVDAINLDGGGSSTMVLARPTPQVVNSPSDASPRRVATSLLVFANPSIQTTDIMAFADFYGGDRGGFRYAPGYSGSTVGIDESLSSNTAVAADDARTRGWVQRLVITDDPSVDSSEHDGGWFVRHLSGSSASQSQNISRPTTGYLGLWARTQTAGIEVSIAIDDANDITADRGVRQAMIADGQWHLYEWNLEDDSQWEGWVSGDGVISGPTFTLDSIQFFGPHSDAVIEIDSVIHNAHGSLAVPEAGSLTAVWVGVGLVVRCRRLRMGGGGLAVVN
ncbi:MAG TPA: phosphodiester glycosidase family protein [Phycisphaeraceae bacterium]